MTLEALKVRSEKNAERQHRHLLAVLDQHEPDCREQGPPRPAQPRPTQPPQFDEGRNVVPAEREGLRAGPPAHVEVRRPPFGSRVSGTDRSAR